MQDIDVREALVAYAAEDAPPPFTSAEVIRAGRRSRRWRQAILVSGCAATVVALAAAAIVVVPGLLTKAPRPSTAGFGPGWTVLDPGPSCAAAAVAATPLTGLPPTVTNAKNGFAIPIPTEPADHAAARISCYLMREVPKWLPGVTYYQYPSSPPGSAPLQAFPARVFDPAHPADSSPPFVSASAVIADAAGIGNVGFGVAPVSQSAADAAQICEEDPLCEVRTGPRGEVVTVLTVTDPSGWVLVNVDVYMGQTVVFAGTSNGLPDPNASPAGVYAGQRTVGRPQPPLSTDDLITIAANPALTMFP